ncbi:MAG: potassium-transporting ATPase subunit C [Gemmataceae bacterium]
MKALRANLILFVSSLVLCCVLYPAVLWAFGQGLFPTKANGSLVTKADGTPVGSTQIAQAFARDEYFWPRPSAAGYNAAATGGSNWGAAQPKLRFRVARQLGPVARYADGRPVGPDVEKWFAGADRLAGWAAANPTAAAEWVKTGDDTRKVVAEWGKAHPEVVEQWKKDNPKAVEAPDPETAPDAVAVQFFASFAAAHPRAFPTLADGKVVAVTTGADLQGVFFDAWLQEHPQAKLEQVPADAVTASGAGVDPHVTVRNARWQLDRVAAARAGVGDAAAVKKRIKAVLEAKAIAPLAGLAGEPLVNVLEVNLALDAEFARR